LPDCLARNTYGGPEQAIRLFDTDGEEVVDDLPLQIIYPTRLPMSTKTADSDHSLLNRFRAGDDDAATALYRRYARRLQALAVRQTNADLSPRFDPEDVVQSVFRTFFRRAAAGYYQVPAGEELWKLLIVLALHKVRDLAVHHRAQKRDVAKTWAVDDRDQDEPRLAVDDRVAYHSLKLVVEELIHDLPGLSHRMIELRIEGRGIAEIAALTERSKRTVERTLQKFREDLRKLIGEETRIAAKSPVVQL
jgi:RNA polymerase sigma-70 factor, ECF subfamily